MHAVGFLGKFRTERHTADIITGFQSQIVAVVEQPAQGVLGVHTHGYMITDVFPFVGFHHAASYTFGLNRHIKVGGDIVGKELIGFHLASGGQGMFSFLRKSMFIDQPSKSAAFYLRARHTADFGLAIVELEGVVFGGYRTLVTHANRIGGLGSGTGNTHTFYFRHNRQIVFHLRADFDIVDIEVEFIGQTVIPGYIDFELADFAGILAHSYTERFVGFTRLMLAVVFFIEKFPCFAKIFRHYHIPSKVFAGKGGTRITIHRFFIESHHTVF